MWEGEAEEAYVEVYVGGEGGAYEDVTTGDDTYDAVVVEGGGEDTYVGVYDVGEEEYLYMWERVGGA